MSEQRNGDWRDDPSWPAVDVVMPILDEAERLAEAISTIRGQHYPGSLNVLMAVGPSVDGTEVVAATLADDDDSLTIIDNPTGRTPSALNAAIRAGSSPVIVRVDGHSQLSDGYIIRAVETLRRTGAVNVGGRQVPTAKTPFEHAVAAATTSWLGTGGATYRVGGEERDVDTVYLGVFDREAIEQVGLFDDDLIRNQDYELNIRLRAAGGRVVFDPELAVGYTPRGSWRALSSQYFQYGRWKSVVMRMHPGATRARQLVPPVAVLASLVAMIIGLRRPVAFIVPLAYVGALASADHRGSGRLRTMLALSTIHLSWVAGLVRGSMSIASSGRSRR